MDRILNGLFNREPGPCVPLSELSGIFRCLRADGGGTEPCVNYFCMNADDCSGNKFFLGILLILLLFGWQVLDQATLLGGGPYRSLLSLELRGLPEPDAPPFMDRRPVFSDLFHLRKGAAGNGSHGRFAPVPPRRFGLIRCASALAGCGLLALACLAEAAVFYAWYFGWHGWGELLLPALVTLVPSLVFALGSGWLLGQIEPEADLRVDGACPFSAWRFPCRSLWGS